GGGRRYYRPEDVDLLRQIRSLLYEEGYTIRGAQKHLKGQRRATHDAENGNGGGDQRADGAEVGIASPDAQRAPELPLEHADVSAQTRERLFDLRAELVALRKVLRDVTG
ncbi:MAG: MerR family transcriptional regulator, partial [Pseudomonadota bacterium]